MSKTFNDPIHGHIELSRLCISIIDTPQFQRLRDISQLGGVYYVFPGASSRRFEHCIGVSHLARKFTEKLRDEQPELLITSTDILCVEIAGLCHDLGHGPFSHLYDGKFLNAINKTNKFIHEHASIGLLDLLISENSLRAHFTEDGLGDDGIFPLPLFFWLMY
jgi:deoxynucleoside triphosphate triphosphohydrolase SAMHD1